jgi:hypothetical protein
MLFMFIERFREGSAHAIRERLVAERGRMFAWKV